METPRLSPLDASFLTVETPTAHMHVGWAAVFEAPEDGPRPGFEKLRRHIASRLSRQPRYRQMLRQVPLGLNAPVWVDDRDFDPSRHVLRAGSARLIDAVDNFMSEPLPKDRPLWQIAIADRLEDGRIGVIGKVHHCMVDGIAAVELSSLLLDADAAPSPPEPDSWIPQAGPDARELVARAIADLARSQLDLTALPARVASSPGRAINFASRARRAAGALVDAARPARFARSLNSRISPRRHLGQLDRPLEELMEIKRAFGVKLNDILLAACAGGVREFLRERGELPIRLKTMVPVSVRDEDDADRLGNQISFIFVDLPCDEPDAVRRVREIHAATTNRKRAGQPEGANDVMRSLRFAPPPIQRLVSRLIATPLAFNLTVSNIPGPREPLYMCGCPLAEVYPVVPIADRHALSIGMTTVGDRAFFGLYADSESLPEVDELAACIDRSIDELRHLSARLPEREPILA